MIICEIILHLSVIVKYNTRCTVHELIYIYIYIYIYLFIYLFILFSYRTKTKYDLVFLEAIFFQSYYGLIHHVGSPPVIGIQSLEIHWSADEAMGNPTNPAFIPEILLPYGNRMTFYERLQSTLFWMWIRCVNLLEALCPY